MAKHNQELMDLLDHARELPAFGSKSELQKALSSPNEYVETGEFTTENLLRQVEMEETEKAGSEAIRSIRRVEKLKTLAEGEDIPTNADDLKDVADGWRKMSDVQKRYRIRKWEGAPDMVRDFIEKDAKDFIGEEGTGVYQTDDAAHQAYQQFFEKYGRVPNRKDADDRDVFRDMYNALRNK
jgi:hypothetical protein